MGWHGPQSGDCSCCSCDVIFEDDFDSYPDGSFSDPNARYSGETGSLEISSGRMENGSSSEARAFINSAVFPDTTSSTVRARLSEGAGLAFGRDGFFAPTAGIYWDGTHLNSINGTSSVIHKMEISASEAESDGSIYIEVFAADGCDSTNMDTTISPFHYMLQCRLKSGDIRVFASVVATPLRGFFLLDEGSWIDDLSCAVGWPNNGCECGVYLGYGPYFNSSGSAIKPPPITPHVFFESSLLSYELVSGPSSVPIWFWDSIEPQVQVELGPFTFVPGGACPTTGHNCSLMEDTFVLDYVGNQWQIVVDDTVQDVGPFWNYGHNVDYWASFNLAGGGFCQFIRLTLLVRLYFATPDQLQWKVYGKAEGSTGITLASFTFESDSIDIATEPSGDFLHNLTSRTWTLVASSGAFCMGTTPTIVGADFV